ncbi:lysylphosphatidylglycerol synthase transmembrane domain-containing protein [Modestobacter sp. VKM Ac-2985]|uniref:lysylphosphatidylglycerol synthase transmembrane domain-containing protein n=1 Tax=Modestobacter sp. VKM Ac-2985 TaxID=3004139 RepID=UPI0022AB5748|nr:lysylphosphatidylglycerol synthase transmembrane domain-containing protein [Modestobacter sp. VKM Ac-2985]MCZ2836991.1 lysylphosphatidylglycerol synthase transmembrane domain-containing protein [Modestobacter sp. VKM Ac-2985]
MAGPLGGALVLAVLVWLLGTEPFRAGVRGLSPGTLLVAVAVGAGTTVCSAWRWRVVVRALGSDLRLPAATAAYYGSQFLNCTLPGGVLGDVHRGLRNGVDCGDPGRGIRAVVWERTAGQVVLVVLALGVLLTLPSPAEDVVPVLAAAAAGTAALVATAGGVAVRWVPAGVARVVRTMAAEARAGMLAPAVLLSSAVVCVGYVGMFLLAAGAVGVEASPVQLLPLAVIVLIAAAIPLNLGGWGPREGVAAWSFAAAGWTAVEGVAVATAFGVLTLVSVLPGAVVLLVGRRLRPTGRAERATQEHHVAHGGPREDGAARG